jgi:hypothetical protein
MMGGARTIEALKISLEHAKKTDVAPAPGRQGRVGGLRAGPRDRHRSKADGGCQAERPPAPRFCEQSPTEGAQVLGTRHMSGAHTRRPRGHMQIRPGTRAVPGSHWGLPTDRAGRCTRVPRGAPGGAVRVCAEGPWGRPLKFGARTARSKRPWPLAVACTLQRKPPHH